ncbi:peptidase M16 (plasmid) [Fulvitalea axinellae]|uniref:Peptidase M16 n=1 Tax=Fulvitalea axinellae TaxID=1182444 RepID=A0AAU9CYJ8_9BACT|nr:peptidase M16 [Fulvitalea axinellae]
MRRCERTVLLFFGLVIALGTRGFSQETSADSPIPFNAKAKTGQLGNGFRYYMQKNGIPKKEVHFRLIINAGSILETEEQRGFAHFLEHMAFNGSEHFPGNGMIDYLQSIGVEFGIDLNAYTGYDETVYMLPMPDNKPETLDQGFHILGDWLGGLKLNTEDIDKERGVILEEWRTTIGLQQRLKDEMYPLLYHGSRYLDRRPIGLMDVVTKEGNDEEIRKFYRDWYRPNLATLVVSGDFDEADMLKRIEGTFGKMKNPENEKERKRYGVPKHKETLVNIIQDKEITTTSVKIISKFPHKEEKTLGDLKRSVVNLLYTYMVNQRLNDIFQKPGAPFLYAQSYATAASGGTDRYVSLATVKSGQIVEGAKGLARELARIKIYGFTQGDLDRKKEILHKDFDRAAMEEDKQTSGQIVGMLSNHVLYGEEYADIKFKKEFVQRVLKEITLKDIQNLVNEYISGSEENRVVLVTAPEGDPVPTKDELLKGLAEVSDEIITAYEGMEIDKPLMSVLPEPVSPVKDKHDEVLDITTLEYANGVTVTLKSTTFKNNEIRFSSLREGGYSRASDANFDNASMAATLVSLGGLGEFDTQQVDRINSGKQVYVAPYMHRYTEGVSGFSSNEDFETLLQLTYLTHTAPRKDVPQFEHFISNKKEYNRKSLNNPDSYFTDGINKVMMQNSPRTATLLTPEKLDKIDLDKAFDFYVSRFGSARGTRFFIVGSFETEKIKPLLNRYLGSLPGNKIKAEFVDHGVRPPKTAERFDFPKNKVDKSKVILRFTGIYPSGQEERIAMGMLSDLLTIRLTKKIREELGGAYAPFSNATVMQRPFNHFRLDVYFTCNPDKLDTLVSASFGEIEQLKKSISEEDLEKVKKALLKNRENSLESNGYWRRVMEDQFTRGETAKDFERYEGQIRNISEKKLRKLAKKYFKVDECLEFVLSPEK